MDRQPQFFEVHERARQQGARLRALIARIHLAQRHRDLGDGCGQAAGGERRKLFSNAGALPVKHLHRRIQFGQDARQRPICVPVALKTRLTVKAPQGVKLGLPAGLQAIVLGGAGQMPTRQQQRIIRRLRGVIIANPAIKARYDFVFAFASRCAAPGSRLGPVSLEFVSVFMRTTPGSGSMAARTHRHT